VSLKDIYQAYGDQIEFIFIYIKEAHPTDGWHLGSTNLVSLLNRVYYPITSFDTINPTSLDERGKIAETCQSKLLQGMPVYVDNMQNELTTKYASWPFRYYLINTDGKVVYESGKGPWGDQIIDVKVAVEKFVSKN